MKVVIAPDKFKGSLDAQGVAQAMARGVHAARPEARVDLAPMADGGEGTVAALVAATGGRLERRKVTGPLPGMEVEAAFGVLGDGKTAVVEMAAASGMALLQPQQRNPMQTTTYGTGQLLLEAAKLGVGRIVLGIGGSATTDGGLGAAQACGIVAADGVLCGKDLAGPWTLSGSTPLAGIEIEVACDVTNPLFGPKGAAPVFAPQKGATPPQVRELDENLRGLAQRLERMEQANIPGAGAAGGLGFGMMAFFAAKLRPGIEIVMRAAGLRQRLMGADLCLTGEGRLDDSSLGGKTAVGVGRLCNELGVPCVVLAGSVGDGAAGAYNEGITAWFSICDGPLTLEEAMRETPRLVESAARNVVRLWAARCGGGGVERGK
jgi:glycerate kinase